MNKQILNIFEMILNRTSTSFREKLFRRVGKSIGVKSYSCSGQFGIIDGSMDDKIVLPYYLRYGNWAPTLQKILANHLFKSGVGTFIDVGANIGLTSLPIAKLGINCMCFEPEFNNYVSLKKNISSNRLEKLIKAYNFALYSEETDLNFEICDENTGDHRIRNGGRNSSSDLYQENSRKTVSVHAKMLDSVIVHNELQRPIVAKVDTQGAEVQVFKGAKQSLNNIDCLITEFWPYGINRMGDTVKDYISMIKDFNFGFCFEDEGEIPALVPIEQLIEKLENFQSGENDTRHLDLFLCRHPENFNFAR
jgi:FkbM family methyltransferase